MNLLFATLLVIACINTMWQFYQMMYSFCWLLFQTTWKFRTTRIHQSTVIRMMPVLEMMCYTWTCLAVTRACLVTWWWTDLVRIRTLVHGVSLKSHHQGPGRSCSVSSGRSFETTPSV